MQLLVDLFLPRVLLETQDRLVHRARKVLKDLEGTRERLGREETLETPERLDREVSLVRLDPRDSG